MNRRQVAQASLSPFSRLLSLLYRRVLLWSFERLYHEFAWSYDLVAAVVSRGYWQRWIVACVPFLQGARVLELGCGTGYLQLALAQQAIHHTGYDASAQMLRAARRRLQRHNVPLRLLRGRAETLPFATASFSDVVATFPAPYILAPATLAEIKRVLAPGGQVVIVDGGQLAGDDLYAAAVDTAYRATLQAAEHTRYLQPLHEAGFAVELQHVAVGPTSVGIVIAKPYAHA